MPEKEVDNGQPLEVIEVDANEVLVILLMVLLQLVHYTNIDPCTC